MERILRRTYLEQLLEWKDKQIVKVVTGVRRCGKSTLMEMMQEELMQQGIQKSQIVTVNFEDYDFIELRDSKRLYEYIKEKLSTDRMSYVFLDEVQHVDNYSDVIDALYINKHVDIYVTGSNAYLLSSEIATYLSGRYVEIKMLPLSFEEFLSAKGDRQELGRRYSEYITESSFPYSLELSGNSRALIEYLNGIYNTVVLKDVMQRKRISDAMMLESVIRFIADNIGNTLSTKRIADTMTSAGRKIDVKTVEKYLSALRESFVLYKASRYDVKGRQLLRTQEKYYLVDVALRRILLGTKATDVGHILENVVYLELLRRNQEVFIGKVGEKEIDFVTTDITGGVFYYQVAATARSQETLERELEPLRELKDHYPKYLLTLDDDPEMDFDGIRKVNVLQWLLQG